MSEKIAFKMFLNQGMKNEYKRRHDLIKTEWKDVEIVLKQAGVKDYSIFLDEETNTLFATLWRDNNHTMDKLPENETIRKWWKYMSDNGL